MESFENQVRGAAEGGDIWLQGLGCQVVGCAGCLNVHVKRPAVILVVLGATPAA
jgi:hypothetical protein